MNDVQLLKFGFVVFLDGVATYDHVVRAGMPYADKLFDALKASSSPAIAKRFYAAHEEGISSPLFCHTCPKSGIESFQSAYYLCDALTRKGILPVYIPSTGEVKDLMPLLSDEQKEDAKAIIQILKARYVRAAARKPERGFMVPKDETDCVDSSTIQLSDAEILRIFGRLPSHNDGNVVSLTAIAAGSDETYITEELAQRA